MQFTYRAIDQNSGIITGTLEEKNSKTAFRILRSQGLNILSLQETKARFSGRTKFNKKPSQKELLIVMRQLATLLRSGITLEDVTSSVADHHQNLYVAKRFDAIRSSLRQGSVFSKALQESGLDLPLYFYPLLESGEFTGKLAQSLHEGVLQWDEEQKVKSEMRQALTYPCILVVTGFVAVLLIFAIVVPKFSSLLAKGKAEVPMLATIVLGTGNFVNDHFLFFVIGLSSLVLIMLYVIKDQRRRLILQNVLARLPLLRLFLLEAALYQWSSMLSTLLSNKVSLDKALEFSQKCIGMEIFRSPMRQVERSVRSGSALSESLLKTNLISSTGYNLIRVGEQSGNLPEMLRSYADILSESNQNRTRRFLTLMEPIAILVIGATVGVIMAGIILAITSVNDIAV